MKTFSRFELIPVGLDQKVIVMDVTPVIKLLSTWYNTLPSQDILSRRTMLLSIDYSKVVLSSSNLGILQCVIITTRILFKSFLNSLTGIKKTNWCTCLHSVFIICGETSPPTSHRVLRFRLKPYFIKCRYHTR